MPRTQGKRVRVMLVEDHAFVRDAVRQAITAPDIEVVAEAGTAEEALAVATEVRPDVLLVDIDLPGMDGVQLVRELAPRLGDTRIVMLTVSPADRDVFEAVQYGAVGYLTKDVSGPVLQRAVRAAHRGELAMPARLATRVVEHLVEVARRAPAAAVDPALAALTDREMQVFRLLVEGLTDREIATALTLSPRTVETHVGNILRKLGARNRVEATMRFRREG